MGVWGKGVVGETEGRGWEKGAERGGGRGGGEATADEEGPQGGRERGCGGMGGWWEAAGRRGQERWGEYFSITKSKVTTSFSNSTRCSRLFLEQLY